MMTIFLSEALRRLAEGRIQWHLALVVRCLGRTILVASLFLPSFSSAALKSESEIKKDQIERIEEDLSREREQFLKFHEKEKDLLAQLSDIEKEIEQNRGSIKELQERIRFNKRALKEGEARLKKLDGTLRDIEIRIGARLDAFYRYAKRGYVRLLATSTGIEEIRKRVKYLNIIMGEDRRSLQEIADVQERQKNEVSLLKETLAEIEGMERAESDHMVSLKRDLDKRVILLAKIHKEREFYETAVKELEAAAQILKKKLLNLEKGQEKKRQLPSGFEKAKGRLPLPLDGKILGHEGDLSSVQREGPKGVYIEARGDTQVKAVFPGRVDYSGWLNGYGEIIIINHGSRFFSVSANLARREKTDGDIVRTGEVIGSLGQVDSSSGSRLYFEIRKGGEILDAMRWLKVR